MPEDLSRLAFAGCGRPRERPALLFTRLRRAERYPQIPPLLMVRRRARPEDAQILLAQMPGRASICYDEEKDERMSKIAQGRSLLFWRR
jgi:hypothetical protein